MTVIFVITQNKYFNVIEETAQTMCMDFINDNVWCIIDRLYQIVPDIFLYISMIDSGDKYRPTTCFSSVVMMNFKIVYVREIVYVTNGYSVRVKVNKNPIVIKKIRINKYIKNEHLNFYQHK